MFNYFLHIVSLTFNPNSVMLLICKHPFLDLYQIECVAMTQRRPPKIYDKYLECIKHFTLSDSISCQKLLSLFYKPL